MSTPWIQVSIDTQTVAEGLKHIDHALAIDAEWIEVGTPLLTFAGIESIRDVKRAAGERAVVADFKAMDGVAQYFESAARLGASVATVMAVATPASLRRAIATAHDCGISVQVDLLNVPVDQMRDTVSRIADLGADYFLLHLAIDELLMNPTSDPLEGLDEAVAASSVPVGPVVFDSSQGVDAVARGAAYVVIGYPILTGRDPRSSLTSFAGAVRHGGTATTQPSRRT